MWPRRRFYDCNVADVRLTLSFRLILAIGLLASSSVVAALDQPSLFELTILHTNGMHSRFDQTDALNRVCSASDAQANRCYGGFGRVVHTVRQFRSNSTAAPVLYLDAGDVFQGTAWFTVHGQRIASAFMNLLAPDAQTLGNHEFDLGLDGLLAYVRDARFPVLAANLNLTAVPVLAAQRTLRPSVVVEIANRRIGIVGYVTKSTQQMTPPTGIDFTDEVAAVNAEIARLRDIDGVRTIIGLGHCSLLHNQRIAAACSGLDIVIGGHDDTLIWTTDAEHEPPPVEDRGRVVGPYPVVVTQPATGKRVPVVHGYAYTKYVGRLCVRLAADGTVQSFDGQPLLMDSRVPRDPDAQALLQTFAKPVQDFAAQPIGESLVLVDGTCASNESNAGNLVTDGLLHAHELAYDVSGAGGASTSPKWSDCALAFFQSGAISRMGKKGNWTVGDLVMLLPYGSRFYGVWLSGAEIVQMLENSVAKYTKNGVCSNDFLQMSGARVVYNVSRPVGERVQRVDLMCTECELPQYERLQHDRRYKCIVSDHMKNGGDGYAMLRAKNYSHYNQNVLEAVQTYMQQMQRVYPAIEGRIQIVGN